MKMSVKQKAGKSNYFLEHNMKFPGSTEVHLYISMKIANSCLSVPGRLTGGGWMKLLWKAPCRRPSLTVSTGGQPVARILQLVHLVILSTPRDCLLENRPLRPHTRLEVLRTLPCEAENFLRTNLDLIFRGKSPLLPWAPRLWLFSQTWH